MAESLFTSQVPASQALEGAPGPTLGIVIVVAVDGQVTHLKWLAPDVLPTNAATLPFVLYNATTQAELARVVPGSLTAGAWNTVALTAPVSVTAGTRLIPAIRTSGRYAFTGGLFATVGITNGNLSAPATGSDPVGNGRFASNADAYPGSTFGGHGYFTDVVFEAGGGGGASVAPAGAAASVVLGAPTASALSGAVPGGIAVPVALGDPTLAWSGSIGPDGIAVPVVLGSPIIDAAPLAPDGIAVPVVLGAPSLAWPGAVSPDGLSVAVAVGGPTVKLPGQGVRRPTADAVSRPVAGSVTRPAAVAVARPRL